MNEFRAIWGPRLIAGGANVSSGHGRHWGGNRFIRVVKPSQSDLSPKGGLPSRKQKPASKAPASKAPASKAPASKSSRNQSSRKQSSRKQSSRKQKPPLKGILIL
ncbi:hypothetical protein RRG08_003297 [Elysia crispata]|uniref:Uncharacterized protein n=1 Tax=Elysia crispata TaxID=231223 RepID=A0AAE1DLN8_9GAST|nr:hypothetical protein RRG08_003297 [Elysia crispata]